MRGGWPKGLLFGLLPGPTRPSNQIVAGNKAQNHVQAIMDRKRRMFSPRVLLTSVVEKCRVDVNNYRFLSTSSGGGRR